MNTRPLRILWSAAALAAAGALVGASPLPLAAQACRAPAQADAPGGGAGDDDVEAGTDGGAGSPISVRGRVTDGTHGIPVPGARVDYRTEGEDGEELQDFRWTDPDGRFRICEIPRGTEVVLSPEVGGGPGDEVEVEAGPEAEVNLVVPLPSPDGMSGLLGTVREAESERRIANAQIRLPELEVTRQTDSRGTVFLSDLDPGSYRIEIEHLSYGTVTDTVHLVAGRPLEMSFSLEPEPIRISGVEATARSQVWFRNHADRRRRMARGHGDYITREEITRRNEPPLHMLFQGVAGVRSDHVSHPWGNTYYPVIRNCGIPAVYVDGARISIVPGAGVGVDDFRSSNIELIEIYKGPGSSPMAYPARGGCGTILIWTHTPG